MIPFHRRTLVLPLSLALVAVAGCGSQAASPAHSTATIAAPTSAAAPTPPVATAAPPPTAVVTGSVAAVVNGHNVPISNYRLLLNLAQRSSRGQSPKVLGQQVMQEVIFNELIREYAVKHHISVSAADVRTQEQRDEASAGSKTAFQKTLSQYGLTLSLYEQLVKPNMLARKVEGAIAPLKPARSDAAAHALALQLLHQLQHGANFVTLARKYSEDPGSATHGGDLGTVFPHQMVAPFDAASFHAPLRTYVIVHSQFGYHIVEVLSRGKGVPPGQPPTSKPVQTAHVRHILISTQPQGVQAQQTKFVAWLHKQEKASSIKRVAQVQG